jgi:hypothetical protein
VLGHLGVAPGSLLGHGGEAWVYALDADRVVRVLHEGGTLEQVARNRALVEELRTPPPSFALPDVLEVGECGGRVYTVERRLPGRPMLEALDDLTGRARDELIEAHLEAAASLGALSLQPREFVGDLAAPTPIRAPTWASYLERKAAVALTAGGVTGIDAAAIARALPEPDDVGFVHLDAFAGNLMVDGPRVTAVLDVGTSCVRGDTRFNALGAFVYLEAPVTTPNATARDRAIGRAWLAAHGLEGLLAPCRAWLAAYWAFEADDPKIRSWVSSVLFV